MARSRQQDVCRFMSEFKHHCWGLGKVGFCRDRITVLYITRLGKILPHIKARRILDLLQH